MYDLKVDNLSNVTASEPHFRRARRALVMSFAIAAGALVAWACLLLFALHDAPSWLPGFTLLAVSQAAVAGYALFEGVRGRSKDIRLRSKDVHLKDNKTNGVGLMLLSGFSIVVAGASWFWEVVTSLSASLGSIGSALGSFGGSWGRPLRVRGQQLHPELRAGSDWTRGDRPDPEGLDLATRRALAALWLHDAQKEHASVPAFARIAWLLAAVGAPPELLRWAHRASIEEIEHTERCFALAAGYGGKSWTVEPMPELLIEGIGRVDDPLSVLVYESITDGGQLEDFNADVAARCAAVCQEPVTRTVLEQIAREERSHAELSWALVEWVAERDPSHARTAADRAIDDLARYPRPTAVRGDKQPLVDQADPAALRRYGRLLDSEWQTAWESRLVTTRARVAALFPNRRAA